MDVSRAYAEADQLGLATISIRQAIEVRRPGAGKHPDGVAAVSIDEVDAPGKNGTASELWDHFAADGDDPPGWGRAGRRGARVVDSVDVHQPVASPHGYAAAPESGVIGGRLRERSTTMTKTRMIDTTR